MVFMQDGAPPHYSKKVRRWLNRNFKHQWMGRLGSAQIPTPMIWPLYSPDLTPCDYFLWGYLKMKVYQSGTPETLEELQERIQHEFDILPQKMIDESVDSFAKRLKKCVDIGGKSVESL